METSQGNDKIMQLPPATEALQPIAEEKEESTPVTPLFVEIPPSSTIMTYTQLPSFRTPRFITQEAVNLVMTQAWNNSPMEWTPTCLQPPADDMQHYDTSLNMEHLAAPVVHPTTGETITKYKKLAADPATRDIWTTAFRKEWGNLAQGDHKTGTKGTNSIFVLDHDQIKQIPNGRIVTYRQIVVNFRPQKEDPNRVRITAGGNLINYPRELITRTAELTTSKILWNSVLSTENAKYMCVDI